MSNHLRRFAVIAVLLLTSMLYYAWRLSQSSELQASFVPMSSDHPLEPASTDIQEDNLEEYEAFASLKDLCGQTQWTQGLWLHCHSYCGENKTSACGGLNNARNRIQTCLRLAIDAGAGVIIPSVTSRKEDDLANTNSSTTCADRFWNMEHLRASLALACPQLRLRFCDDRKGIEHVIPTRERNYAQAPYFNGTFRAFVETAVEIAGFNRSEISEGNQAVVSFGDTLIAWSYRASGELDTIRKALFKTLAFNQDLLDLGARIHQNPLLRDGAYVGIHFRGESDWPVAFGSADHQRKFYREELLRLRDTVTYNMRTVYISCGDQVALNNFGAELLELNFSVVDKTSLLQGQRNAGPLAAIESMDFDQRGIVEYETLVRSKVFLGIAMSTMSSLIAYARTMASEEEDFFETYIFQNSWKIGINRNYEGLGMRGNNDTRLMVVSGADVMDSFP